MLQQNSEGRSNKPWTWCTCWMNELPNPFACDADQRFDIKVECPISQASFGQIPHCMKQNWLVRIRVSQYCAVSRLFHKQLQWNPDNSNSDNLNSLLTRTKSNFPLDFTPLFSHLYLVNFNWDILNFLLTRPKFNFPWSKIHWNLPQ